MAQCKHEVKVPSGERYYCVLSDDHSDPHTYIVQGERFHLPVRYGYAHLSEAIPAKRVGVEREASD